MRKTQKNTRECCDATFRGIHSWYKSLFEKMGWMILAKQHGLLDKITAYKTSLERLKQTIEKKALMKDTDKKQDLHIMLTNVEFLILHVDKDF